MFDLPLPDIDLKYEMVWNTLNQSIKIIVEVILSNVELGMFFCMLVKAFLQHTFFANIRSAFFFKYFHAQKTIKEVPFYMLIMNIAF